MLILLEATLRHHPLLLRHEGLLLPHLRGHLRILLGHLALSELVLIELSLLLRAELGRIHGWQDLEGRS